MIKTCPVSGKQFEVTSDDLKFYEKMGVPAPTLCPEERQRRRLAWRNERNLYRGKCGLCGESMISMFDPQKEKVYCSKCWWGDDWEGKGFGQDIDFDRPFFEQFQALWEKVPKFNLANQKQENCDYCNHGESNKNSYLCFSNGYCEDAMYSEICLNDKDIVDCISSDYCELGYELVDCQRCFEVFFSQNSHQCQSSWFLQNCRNCKNCFGCVNLWHKEFYIFNKQHTKESYEAFMSQFLSGNNSVIQKLRQQFEEFCVTQIQREDKNLQTENCTGDYLINCKNCHDCVDLFDAEDCRFSTLCLKVKNCWDSNFNVGAECLYETIASMGFGNNFCNFLLQGKDLFYSMFLMNCQDCFGCMGLKHKKYCILNKQYSKEEYFKLRDRLIDHMKKTTSTSSGSSHGSEWGEFFPVEISPFSYNETVAHEYFPMTKEEVIERGWRWKEDKDSYRKHDVDVALSRWDDVPDSIAEVSDDICNKVLSCQECNKQYKIQKAELKFYRKMNLPIPRKCPKCRYLHRLELRGERTIHDRQCDKCQKGIKTTFGLDRPEKVYCEKCYLKEVN